MRWGLGILVILVVAFGGFIIYSSTIVNPRVVQEIVDNPDGPRARKAMIITFPDERRIPVNYLREGDKVFVGADGPWWRDFRDPGVNITMIIRGEKFEGRALAILDDPAYTDDVFSRLRPTAPDWLPRWANGKLIEITLAPEANSVKP